MRIFLKNSTSLSIAVVDTIDRPLRVPASKTLHSAPVDFPQHLIFSQHKSVINLQTPA